MSIDEVDGHDNVIATSDFYYNFNLTQPSEVLVYVNDEPTYQVKLPAGRYQIKDIPMDSGFNRVRIETVGGDGSAHSVEDSYYQRYDMLSIEEYEYDISLGYPMKNRRTFHR